MLLPLAVALFAISGWQPASAHRLDEYLQATRIAIGIDRVDLEIDLTPGAAMSTTAFRWLDTDSDGTISQAESQAYASQVLGSLTLSADGEPAALSLIDSRAPDLAEMTAGFGTIRLHASATLPPAGSGRHAVTYTNTHRPDISVYLANALVPADPHIAIDGQQRDVAQRTLTVTYDVAGTVWSRWPKIGMGCVALALLAMGRWRATRKAPPVASAERS